MKGEAAWQGQWESAHPRQASGLATAQHAVSSRQRQARDTLPQAHLAENPPPCHKKGRHDKHLARHVEPLPVELGCAGGGRNCSERGEHDSARLNVKQALSSACLGSANTRAYSQRQVATPWVMTPTVPTIAAPRRPPAMLASLPRLTRSSRPAEASTAHHLLPSSSNSRGAAAMMMQARGCECVGVLASGVFATPHSAKRRCSVTRSPQARE